MYSRTMAPKAQQIVSRKDMLKMSKRRRCMLVDELDDLENDARAHPAASDRRVATPPAPCTRCSFTNEP